jgi:hypothetical protein
VIVDDPSATAVTSPALDTLATLGLDEVQLAVAVTSWVVVLVGLSVAVNWLVCPTTKKSPPLKEMVGEKVVAGPGVVGLVTVGVVGLDELEHEETISARTTIDKGDVRIGTDASTNSAKPASRRASRLKTLRQTPFGLLMERPLGLTTTALRGGHVFAYSPALPLN